MTKPTPDSAIITQLSMLNDGGAALLAYLAAFAPAGGTTHNYMPSCGVTTVYSGCTIIEGGNKNSTKKAGGNTKAPEASKPATPAPPTPAPPSTPAPQELNALDADDDDDDDDDAVVPPPAPPSPPAPPPVSAPPAPVAPPPAADIFTIPGSIVP